MRTPSPTGQLVPDASWDEVTCRRCLRMIERGLEGKPAARPKKRPPAPPGYWSGELIAVSFDDLRQLEILKDLNLGRPLPAGFFVVASAELNGPAQLTVLDYRRRPDLAQAIRDVARRA